MEANEIREWFAAALVHDLGKIVLNKAGSWEHHERLDEKPFGGRLPASIVDKAKIHHDLVDLDARSHSPQALALIMVDGFQQAMAQVPRGPDELRQYPAFYPYYGPVEPRYDQHKVQTLISHVTSAVSKSSSMKGLLELQGELTHYPYASYLPHLSLALHHRFTALLLYFLMRRMDGGLPPTVLEFSVLAVSPEPMTLFYRLRDVDTHRRVVERLRDRLFRQVFLADQAALPGLAPTCNPFEFFDGGSGLVLVYDQPKRVIRALQEILDEEPFLRSLQIEQADFYLTGQWKPKGGAYTFWAEPADVKYHTHTWSLLSTPVMDYPSVSLERCQVCGKPDEKLAEDVTGDLLCPSCLKERQQRRGKIVDIHKVSDRGAAKVGFVFLTVKEPLYEQAQEVAADLLGEFMNQRVVEQRTLEPTPIGLLEYLQAIIAVGEFQDRVEEALEKFRREKANAAYTLLRLPTKMVYLVHEDFYWRFLGFLNEERDEKRLRFLNSLRAVLCGPKTPFWSLMDGFLTYDGQDLYYDEAEGSIVMFTSDEVRNIRDLAAKAERDWRSSAQLIALSRFALTHNLAELLLETDVRARQDKLPWRLTDPLKKALEGLEVPDDERKAQTKRAKFIDYIAKMARPQRGGGKRRR